MQKLIYAREWDKIPERTWSGTAYNLRKNLETYFEVSDCKLPDHCIWDYLIKHRLLKPECGLKKILSNRKKFSSLITKDVPVFQFDETFLKTPSFLFIDLCVEFLCRFAETNPEIFIFSGFQQIPLNNLKKRAAEQNMYINEYCSHIFTMGRWLKNFMVQTLNLPEDRITAVGGGININKDKINYSKKTGKRILFVGRDFKRKGGYIVVEAFKKLKHEMSDVELYIAGPNTNPIQENIEGLHFLGDISSDILHDYFNLCDIFCMPSYFEAYGLVFIEALSFGLPCIGRNSFEMPYFIQENETGYLLKEDNADTLKQLMKNALENKTMQNHVKEKRDEYLNEYSWKNVAERCKAIIHEKTN